MGAKNSRREIAVYKNLPDTLYVHPAKSDLDADLAGSYQLKFEQMGSSQKIGFKQYSRNTRFEMSDVRGFEPVYELDHGEKGKFKIHFDWSLNWWRLTKTTVVGKDENVETMVASQLLLDDLSSKYRTTYLLIDPLDHGVGWEPIKLFKDYKKFSTFKNAKATEPEAKKEESSTSNTVETNDVESDSAKMPQNVLVLDPANESSSDDEKSNGPNQPVDNGPEKPELTDHQKLIQRLVARGCYTQQSFQEKNSKPKK